MAETSQLKISLSAQTQQLLKRRAEQLGVPVTQLIKHLIIQEISEEEPYRTYPASDRTIGKARQALAERDKAVHVDDLDQYFANLVRDAD